LRLALKVRVRVHINIYIHHCIGAYLLLKLSIWDSGSTKSPAFEALPRFGHSFEFAGLGDAHAVVDELIRVDLDLIIVE
jgi:hypothetical protein